MESHELQQHFFQQLKNRLEHHLSLAEEVADLLNISTDSAYRRIRGEKPVSLDELQKLCTHFKISLDQLLSLDSKSMVFYGNLVDSGEFNFEKYLSDWLKNMTFINSATDKMLYYESKDIPIYHHWQFPGLASFKYFFWMKTILGYPSFNKMYYEDNSFDDSLYKTGLQIIKTYNIFPSVEIWNAETINSTIHQIEFHKESGVFKRKESITALYEQLELLVNHIEAQAEIGQKFLAGEKPAGNNNNFRLFFNEVFLGHNTALAETDDMQTVFINHGVLNFITTHDKRFCAYTKRSMENIMRKSSLISSVSEKERSRYFNSLKAKIAFHKQMV
jgi:transcriptional regulator with XRE-family HTH domain